MTSDQTEREQRGIVIPMWAWGIIAGGLLMVGGWTASTLLALRDQAGVLTEKVRVLELGDGSRSVLPVQIAEVRSELGAVRAELGALREDIRRLRPSLGDQRITR